MNNGTVQLLGMCIWGALSGACAAPVDATEESIESVDEGINTSSCATAARDANLNGSADQHAGANSPFSYDNPGCNEGYIVELDGTVSGVHVGYKLAEPLFTNDGIQVSFFPPSPNPLGFCQNGMMLGLAYLYEKVNGAWVFRGSVSSETVTPVFNFGKLVACKLVPKYFNVVHHGTASNPHIYRVAATLDILMPELFQGGPAAFPDGKGYGNVFIRACDADNTCPEL